MGRARHIFPMWHCQKYRIVLGFFRILVQCDSVFVLSLFIVGPAIRYIHLATKFRQLLNHINNASIT